MSAIHSKATAFNLTLDDIWSYSATTLLATVEYATLDHQKAIGNGVDNLYIQSVNPFVAGTQVNFVVVTDAQAATFITGAIIEIGTTDGGSQIARRVVTGTENYEADSAYSIINFDGAPADITVAQFVSVHGLSNKLTPEILSTSGYIGANSKSNAYYRGQVHHGNLYRYCLGAYRQKDTSKIWNAQTPSGAAAVDALDADIHTDTGFILPTGAEGIAASGYLGGLHISDIPLAPFGSSVTGSSANPVGDYLYVPALSTADTVLRVGGYSNYGSGVGRFCGYWNNSAASGNWARGALPFLKTP